MENKKNVATNTTNNNETSAHAYPNADRKTVNTNDKPERNTAFVLRRVFNIESDVYTGPLFSTQLYRFGMKDGSEIFAYPSGIDKKATGEYVISVSPVLDTEINKVNFEARDINIADVESIDKKHPRFDDLTNNAVGQNVKLKAGSIPSYTIFTVKLKGNPCNFEDFSLLKFVTFKKGPLMFGYIKDIVDNGNTLVVDSIRFVHSAIQRAQTRIKVTDLMAISRQKISIEEYVRPQIQKPVEKTSEDIDHSAPEGDAVAANNIAAEENPA